jgi:hypothetical protein
LDQVPIPRSCSYLSFFMFDLSLSTFICGFSRGVRILECESKDETSTRFTQTGVLIDRGKLVNLWKVASMKSVALQLLSSGPDSHALPFDGLGGPILGESNIWGNPESLASDPGFKRVGKIQNNRPTLVNSLSPVTKPHR